MGSSNTLRRAVAALAVTITLVQMAAAQSNEHTSTSTSGGTGTGNPKLVQTSVPGVHAFAVPPKEFSLLTASDAELRDYGIWPRPDRLRAPTEYDAWVRTFSKTRIIPEVRTNPSVVHMPADIKKTTFINPYSAMSISNNWSGYVITDTRNVFSTPGTRISAIFPQPKAVSGCTQGPKDYHSSYWVGIDGWNSNDVLQVGTELDMNCDIGSSNYGWIEWYDSKNKYPEIPITNLPVTAGDLVEADVWLEPTSGPPAYVLYFSAGSKYVLLHLSPPPGVTLVGNCVEWVAERTTNNGTYANMTNYLLMPWFGVNTVITGTTLQQFRPSSFPSTSTLTTVVMEQGASLSASEPHLYPGQWPATWDDAILFSTQLPY